MKKYCFEKRLFKQTCSTIEFKTFIIIMSPEHNLVNILTK